MCGNIYQKAWSDEEAMKECEENFGEELAADSNVVVCTDCYNKVHPHNHPEEVQAAKEDLKRSTDQ